MFCQSRTVGAGAAVLASSIVLMSVSWQFVLLLFSLAGIGWSFYSFFLSNEDASKARRAERKARYRVLSTREPAPEQEGSENNIYQFPNLNWEYSEAAD